MSVLIRLAASPLAVAKALALCPVAGKTALIRAHAAIKLAMTSIAVVIVCAIVCAEFPECD